MAKTIKMEIIDDSLLDGLLLICIGCANTLMKQKFLLFVYTISKKNKKR